MVSAPRAFLLLAAFGLLTACGADNGVRLRVMSMGRAPRRNLSFLFAPGSQDTYQFHMSAEGRAAGKSYPLLLDGTFNLTIDHGEDTGSRVIEFELQDLKLSEGTGGSFPSQAALVLPLVGSSLSGLRMRAHYAADGNVTRFEFVPPKNAPATMTAAFKSFRASRNGRKFGPWYPSGPIGSGASWLSVAVQEEGRVRSQAISTWFEQQNGVSRLLQNMALEVSPSPEQTSGPGRLGSLTGRVHVETDYDSATGLLTSGKASGYLEVVAGVAGSKKPFRKVMVYMNVSLDPTKIADK